MDRIVEQLKTDNLSGYPIQRILINVVADAASPTPIAYAKAGYRTVLIHLDIISAGSTAAEVKLEKMREPSGSINAANTKGVFSNPAVPLVIPTGGGFPFRSVQSTSGIIPVAITSGGEGLCLKSANDNVSAFAMFAYVK